MALIKEPIFLVKSSLSWLYRTGPHGILTLKKSIGGGALKLRLMAEVDKFGYQLRLIDCYPRKRDRERKSSWPCATRIDKDDAVSFSYCRFMRVAGDYDIDWRGNCLHGYRAGVMCEQKNIGAHGQAMSDGQRVGPLGPIIIAFDSDNGGDGLKVFKDVRRADIPGMQDEIAALEGLDRFGTQQPVCV